MTAHTLAILSAGVFFLVALLTGVWKYLQIRDSEDAQAHPYVDVAHRASLMYSFAAMLLAAFIEISQLPPRVVNSFTSVSQRYWSSSSRASARSPVL